ncbi:MAG TPA: ATP synthase F1 subunit gamma [Armatimonadota bacterium]|nr:ATP synthase F1 subunit gamma [Armatimonadota bacterium]
MPSVRELRGRIRSVQNIQKITAAMKLVAAARQKKAQDRVNAARPYAEKIVKVMHELAASTGGNTAAVFAESDISTPASREAEELLRSRPINVQGLFVVSGERGLCGSYNANVQRRAMEAIRGLPRENVVIVVVGKKAAAFFQKRGYRIVHAESMPASSVPFSLAAQVGQVIRRLYTSGEVDGVEMVYTRSLSAMSQRPTAQTLLPVQIEKEATVSGPSATYIFEPTAPELLGSLVPRYINSVIYQALLESNAGEHGARMIAMSSATDNASDLVKRLTLLSNRARQAGITKELLEIVAGAEALKG